MNRLKYILLIIVGIQFYACNTDDNIYTVYKGDAKTEKGKLIAENTNLIAMVKTDTTYSLTPGIETTEIHYVNDEGYSTKVFLTEIDLNDSKVKIEVTTPNNSPLFDRQPMTSQAYHVDEENHRVWAGINGDFFNLSTGVPNGIVYKNGVALKTSFLDNVTTWFAIKEDGKASIGNINDYDLAKEDFKEAISGRVTLIDNGLLQTQTDTRLEPRTAIGVSKDGSKVYFLVVDGRNFTYSNGMTYSQMGEMLLALGTYDAINLDGGGSSTFFVRNTPDFIEERFEVRNWPYDNGGQERSVANGLVVISE